ncbi:hypothetical protein OIU77_021394 [Salix suchowensis]|uniref:EF-hand domain-containing protein n=1 Tax=Salix suchowensis TaxID=1278906 RepID=A0ABQ9C9M2_9ROSI|nr:hypothetical protein OIU77_021394 [Salix suchowensis]
MEGDTEDLIHLVSFPDGLESGEDRVKPGKRSETFLRLMPGKIKMEFIERINALESDKISCVLADQTIGWALELAEKKGIKRAAFCSAAAAMLVQGFSIPKLIEDGIIDKEGIPTKMQTIMLSPTMPAIYTAQLVGLGFNKDGNGIITRGEIKNKVDQLLSYEEFKATPLELKKTVVNSIKEGGSSYQNFKKFIEWIKA